MGNRTDLPLAQLNGATSFNGAGTMYLIQTPAGVLYLVHINVGVDVAYIKSTDGGRSWTDNTTVFVGTTTSLAVWYDRWSNISAGLIHCAYQESVTDDTLYRTINTESADALSTQTTIFAGGTTAAGGCLSITRARGGNVYCHTVIDAGAEGGFFRLPNANVPNGAWDAARTNPEALATQDQIILLPGFAADAQDIMAFFWDASANEVSRYLHDDSANTWAETSIATGMTDTPASTSFANFAAAVDLTNSRNLLVAWTDDDLLNADLRCWYVTESAITETTNVVLNSTDDQGLCAICLDTITNVWWVFYVGASNGSETYPTAVNIYCKASADSGTTWGPETKLTPRTWSIPWLITVPRLLFSAPLPPPVCYQGDSAVDIVHLNICLDPPHTRSLIGI